jgi:hypothetical protein
MVDSFGGRKAGCRRSRMTKTKIKKCVKPTACSAWAWWDAEEKQFRHVYPKRFCVEICFPDGGKHATEQGRGRIMQVTVSPKGMG